MVPSAKWLWYKRKDPNSDPQHSCKESVWWHVSANSASMGHRQQRIPKLTVQLVQPNLWAPASVRNLSQRTQVKGTWERHSPSPNMYMYKDIVTHTKSKIRYFYIIYLCGGGMRGACLPTPTHTLQTYGGQRTSFSNPFAPSNMWDLEMELRLSGLAGNTFTHWAILTVPIGFI